MSYAEMRKALEAVQGDMEEIGHIKASTGKQVDAALKSVTTVSDLVDELRKRDGVEAIDVPVEGESQIMVWNEPRPYNDVEGDCAKYNGNDNGAATILRITE